MCLLYYKKNILDTKKNIQYKLFYYMEQGLYPQSWHSEHPPLWIKVPPHMGGQVSGSSFNCSNTNLSISCCSFSILSSLFNLDLSVISIPDLAHPSLYMVTPFSPFSKHTYIIPLLLLQ